MSEKQQPSSLRKGAAIVAATIATGLGIGAASETGNNNEPLVNSSSPEQQAPETSTTTQPEEYPTGDKDPVRNYDKIPPLPGPIHGTIPDSEQQAPETPTTTQPEEGQKPVVQE